MADRLETILERKWQEVAGLKRGRRGPGAPRHETRCDFAAAIARQDLGVIAEIKRRSPSRGEIRAELDIEATARSFERHGATAISVLTDGPFFGGSLDDLVAVRRATRLPILRKDFLVDELQLEDSLRAGADAVLLIVRVLGRRLAPFLDRCRALGLDALVEVHDEADLQVALDGGAHLIGVNNRDLASFEVDRSTAPRLRPLIPAECLSVAESGIVSRDDVVRLLDAGFDACLVGETLMREPDPGAAIDVLLGRTTVAAP